MSTASTEQRLHSLQPTARVYFAAACANRLALAFASHSTVVSHKALFEKGLATLWAGGHDPQECTRLSEAVLELMPPETESHLTSALAEDAVAALTYALQCAADPSVDHAKWAAMRAKDAAVELARHPLHDQVRLTRGGQTPPEMAHKLVIDELCHQSQDLELLEEEGELSQKATALRARALARVDAFRPP